MYVCMYVYMYECVYVWMEECMYLCMCVYVWMQEDKLMDGSMHAQMHASIE